MKLPCTQKKIYWSGTLTEVDLVVAPIFISLYVVEVCEIGF